MRAAAAIHLQSSAAGKVTPLLAQASRTEARTRIYKIHIYHSEQKKKKKKDEDSVWKSYKSDGTMDLNLSAGYRQ